MATILKPAPTTYPVKLVPELENGDRLTRVEFERRYEAMPELKKAELIEGVVYFYCFPYNLNSFFNRGKTLRER